MVKKRTGKSKLLKHLGCTLRNYIAKEVNFEFYVIWEKKQASVESDNLSMDSMCYRSQNALQYHRSKNGKYCSDNAAVVNNI